ncbi:MAG: peptidase M48 Ste24p [Phyllobacteriaceae bacterium]|nr:peptidase M48 Ste24p [Phyllobacteriaceae bacterium]MBA90230.1 peptidase M48 Ste24p [Phyllobacteriaceae bacterium]
MNAPPRLDLLEQERHRSLNRFHTWLLVAGSLGLLGVTAWIFAGVTGVVLAVFFGAIALSAMQGVSPKIVLSMYKAREAGPDLFPSGNRIVTELARRANLPAVPRLYIVPSRMMNAFAVGRPDDSAVAITDGLARALTERELAGVLAHEISHIAHEDLKVMALADIVTRYTSAMSTAGFVLLFFNLFGGGLPWLAILLLLAAPTIGSLLQLALSRTREFDADLGAAMLTGDPDGLSSALWKLERFQVRQWEGMMLPGGRMPAPSILRSHPKTEERVARLSRLKTPDGLAIPMPALRPRRGPLVPSVHSESGRYRLLQAAPGPWTDDAVAPECPECRDKPRIRMSRGGVWW